MLELSFDAGPLRDSAKLGILIGSLLAGVLGAAALRWDARRARDADMNRDGIPDSDIDEPCLLLMRTCPGRRCRRSLG